jgi:hypothetical protein
LIFVVRQTRTPFFINVDNEISALHPRSGRRTTTTAFHVDFAVMKNTAFDRIDALHQRDKLFIAKPSCFSKSSDGELCGGR